MRRRTAIILLVVLHTIATSMLLLGFLDVVIFDSIVSTFVFTSIFSMWIGPMFAFLFYCHVDNTDYLNRNWRIGFLVGSFISFIAFFTANSVKAVQLEMWWLIFIYLIITALGFLTYIIAKKFTNSNRAFLTSIFIPAIIAGIVIVAMVAIGYYLLMNSSSSSSSSSSGNTYNMNNYSSSLDNSPGVKNSNGRFVEEGMHRYYEDSSGRRTPLSDWDPVNRTAKDYNGNTYKW